MPLNTTSSLWRTTWTCRPAALDGASSAAQRNAESLLFVRNAPVLAASHSVAWRQQWIEGIDPPPAF
jgi:hypothetical protein